MGRYLVQHARPVKNLIILNIVYTTIVDTSIMKIEDEIKQTAFSSEYHKLWVNMIFTVNWLRTKELKLFRRHGLSPQQYNVLRILRGQHPKPASLNLIRERMLDRESNASRLVDKLCENGLTTRIECPNNRRSVEIRLTEKGLTVLRVLDADFDTLMQHILHIEPGDAVRLNALLDDLRNSPTGERAAFTDSNEFTGKGN